MTSSPPPSQLPRLIKCGAYQLVGPTVPEDRQSRDDDVTLDDGALGTVLLLRPPLVLRQADGKFRVVANLEGFWYAQHRIATEPHVSQDVWVILLPSDSVAAEVAGIDQTLAPFLLNTFSTRERRTLRRELKKLDLPGVKLKRKPVRLAAVAKMAKR